MDYLSADVRVLVPGVWQEFTSTTINVKDASKCIRYFCRSEVDIFSREVRLVCVQSRPTVCVVVRHVRALARRSPSFAGWDCNQVPIGDCCLECL